MSPAILELLQLVVPIALRGATDLAKKIVVIYHSNDPSIELWNEMIDSAKNLNYDAAIQKSEGVIK